MREPLEYVVRLVGFQEDATSFVGPGACDIEHYFPGNVPAPVDESFVTFDAAVAEIGKAQLDQDSDPVPVWQIWEMSGGVGRLVMGPDRDADGAVQFNG